MTGCMAANACAEPAKVTDGVYRGAFTDPKQVEVEFEIKDNVFTSFKFRALGFKDANYLKNDDATILAVGQQYVDLGNYLVGKDVSAVQDLYTPANITSDVDAFTAATVRSSKVISAINDAIARKPYKLTEHSEVVLASYQDGTYRGGYLDSTQVQVEFVLKDNKFESIKLRALGYKGSNYLKSEVEMEQNLTKQYQAVLDYLTGKPLSAIAEVYQPGSFVQDMDTLSGATIHSSKIISAINSALARGVYKPAAK